MRVLLHLLPTASLLIALLYPTQNTLAQSISPDSSTAKFVPLVLAIVVIAILFAISGGYFLWNSKRNPNRSLLMVSTDDEARMLVKSAAHRVGYNAVTVYRYEDALERLRQDITIGMIIIDDSVPQYEAGMLLSMLQRLPIGIRPLILIHDSSEAGQTAPSYRAEVVVERPLTVRILEDAIRKVGERIEVDW